MKIKFCFHEVISEKGILKWPLLFLQLLAKWNESSKEGVLSSAYKIGMIS